MADPDERYLILSCFKNEAPFILEWVAYHRVIGFHDFLIYTNDCDDGTAEILDRMARLGIVTHRDNTQQEGQRPSHQVRAYLKARSDPMYLQADWVAILDADEFLNVHVGKKRVQELTAAVAPANTISLTWRVFGDNGQIRFGTAPVIRAFQRAAPHFSPRPAQVWAMKSLFRREIYARLGAHRPRVPVVEDWSEVHWVDGNGRIMPERFHADNWRHDRDTYGYDLAQVNHYAVRSRQSFLLKQLRGRALGGRNLDLTYWNWMNRNEEEDRSILSLQRPTLREVNRLLQDDILRGLHEDAVATYQARIAEVIMSPDAKATLAQMAELAAAPPSFDIVDETHTEPEDV